MTKRCVSAKPECAPRDIIPVSEMVSRHVEIVVDGLWEGDMRGHMFVRDPKTLRGQGLVLPGQTANQIQDGRKTDVLTSGMEQHLKRADPHNEPESSIVKTE